MLPPNTGCATCHNPGTLLKPRTSPVDIQYGLEPLRSCQLRRLGGVGGLVRINPFSGGNGGFFALVGDEEQHSLWPNLVQVGTCRRPVYGETMQAAPLDHTGQNRTDMRPKSLHKWLRSGRAVNT